MLNSNSRLMPLLATIALLPFALALSACGGDDSVSQEELERAVDEATQKAQEEAQAEQELSDLQKQVRALKRKSKRNRTGGGGGNAVGGGGGNTGGGTAGGGATGGTIPGGVDNCGAGVYAQSSTTSCPFALNVANDYYLSPGNTFDSYSPATDRIYTMTCTGFDPVVCRGGNNAVVYIR